MKLSTMQFQRFGPPMGKIMVALALASVLGRPVDALNLVGGGGQSDVWCQIVADVLGVTVLE